MKKITKSWAFLLSPRGKAWLEEHYLRQGESTHAIAAALKTYPGAIRNALLKHGIPMRTKADAQAMAIETGRTTHPTRGRKRTAQEKRAIGAGSKKAWEGRTDREEVSRQARQRWESLPEQDRARITKLGLDAVREASRRGSRLQNFITDGLRRAGYRVLTNRRVVDVAERMHIDILLPAAPLPDGTACRVAVEVDGPSHFLPVWGQERLQATAGADARKHGLLRASGFALLRVCCPLRSVSQLAMDGCLNDVLTTLRQGVRPQEYREVWVR